MASHSTPDPYAAAAAPPRPPQRPRRWRTAARVLGGLVVAALVLLAALWWWMGTGTSLAAALARAAQHLPAGQSLESRDVTGSLRGGGHIGWLRWSSPTLEVEVQDARIGWQLAPLLRRQVQLGEVHAAQVTVTPRGEPSQEPTQPLQQLALPVRVHLPFQVDHITWAAANPITIDGLAGSYRYDGDRHHLDVDRVTLAQGQYALQATLQAQAPMALEARAPGTGRTPVPGGEQLLQAQAQAHVQGTLATQEARLQVQAQLRGEGRDSGPPLSADVQARIAPWAPQPLLQAAAELQALDLAALWPQAPATQLSGSVGVEPEGEAGWRIAADLRNALPGPWDQQRLPLDALQARAAFDGTTWTVPEATLHAGGGTVAAQGAYTPGTHALQGQVRVQGLNPARLHTALDAAPVNGTASAEGRDDGAVRFNADLRAAAAPRRPARAGTAAPLRLERLAVQGTWQGERIDIARLDLDALQAQVRAQSLRIDTAAQSVQGRVQANVPGATAQADGQIAPASGGGTLSLRLADALRAQQWAATLPVSLEPLAAWSLDGNAELNARWSGGWQTLQRDLRAAGLVAGAAPARPGNGRFELQAQLNAPRLRAARAPQPGTGSGPVQIELQRTTAALRGSVPQAALELDGTLRQGAQQAQLHLRANAGNAGAGRWQAQVAALQVQASVERQSGPWQLRLSEPLTLSVQQQPRLQVDASAGQARITGPQPGEAVLRWQPVHFAQGAQGAVQLRSQGELQGLPLAWANAFAMDGQPALMRLGVAGDLVLGADWNIDAADTLRATARVRRTGGDLRILTGDTAPATVVHSSGQGKGAGAPQAVAVPGTPAGLRQLELQIDAEGDALRAQVQWDSERAGQLQAQGSTRLARAAEGGWLWPADAPLAATVRAELPDVGVWSALAPPGWRVKGTLSADARLSGSRAAPRWSGQLAADQFAVRSLLDGVDLQDGRLRAQLRGDRLDITELSLKGGRGSRARIAGYSGNRTAAPQDGGTLTGSGTVSWAGAGSGAGGSGIAMDMRARAQALQVLVRADRQVSVSGDLHAQLQGGQFTLRGQLTTDRATILLPEAGAPTLGDDVVVRSAALDREAAAKAQQAAQAAQAEDAGRVEAAKPPDVAVTLDLGEDFALQGHGITTRLKGRLDIRVAGGAPRVTGEIHTEQGRYRAWGQALDVETGLIRFNGPYDNPALDVLAIRPNISQRAGVQVTGSAKAPRVRLYSEPDLPDAEKLSWVVLGRSAAAGGAEAALLQQAALALLGGGGTGGNFAQRLGLDEIGFKGPESGDDASGAALTFGKRLSKDLYVTYERSLSGVLGTLYIFYDLSQRLTLRGQTGLQSAVDLIYTVRYD
jgi:translocation and assembly module TamB